MSKVGGGLAFMKMFFLIIELVDSICRDGTDTPISLNKLNGSGLSNGAVIGLFRHIAWPTSVFIHNKTLKVGKIHRFSDLQKIAKPPISPSSSLSNGLP